MWGYFSSIDGTLYSKYVGVTCFCHEHNETFSKSPHPVSGFMVNVCSCKECSHHENESLTLARTKALSLTHTYPDNPLRKIEVTMYNHQQADSPLYVFTIKVGLLELLICALLDIYTLRQGSL